MKTHKTSPSDELGVAACYARPLTRGELKEKLLAGIPCEVVTIAVETTVVMFHGWLKFTGFRMRQSENEGWTIFEPNAAAQAPLPQPCSAALWQSYCAVEAHLKLLSKVVIDGNQSAALQFALQTEGILDDRGFKPNDLAQTRRAGD